MKKIYEVHKHKSLKENLRSILPEMFDDFFALGDTVANYPMRKNQLHEMRKAGKPLRYAMELGEYCFSGELSLLLDEVKHVLELMGEIHDADVMIPELMQQAKDMVSFNRTVKEPEQKISTTSLKEAISKLRNSRNGMFNELSSILNEWATGTFRSKLCSAVEPGTS